MPRRTTSDLVQERLGVRSYEVLNPVVEEIGVAAIQILRTNPNRLWISIVNLSANIVYVSPFANVAAAAGYRLNANGGTISFNYMEDLELVSREWWGIAAGANSAVMIVEQVIQKDS